MRKCFAGSEANELAILCRPYGGLADPMQQADAAYRALAALLAAEQASFRDLATETLFVRDIQRDLPLLLEARARVLNELGHNVRPPQPTFIDQEPVDRAVSFELSALGLVPRRRDAWSIYDFCASLSCPCAGCRQSAARLVRLGDQISLYTSNIYGAGGN